MTYREMEDVLGGEERESAAVRDLGRWRDRTRTAILLAFAVAGLVPAAIGYWLVQEAQFRHNDGVALLLVNVAGAAVPWLVVVFVGRLVGRTAVVRGMEARVALLAERYEIPKERLAKTAELVKRL